jgi:glycyl-tRNA synthetase beta chain
VTRDLLIELGAEEIPAAFVAPALEDMARVFTEKCAAARLAHGEVLRFGTPRRLALLVRDVAEESQSLTRTVQGPSAKVAFDASGAPTQAAERFAAGQGKTAADLERVSTPKGEYVSVRVTELGKPAAPALAEVLHAVVRGIGFKKSMRWGDVEPAFARPLHWIVALFGAELIPVVFGDVRSDRRTYGHRFLAPESIELGEPSEYQPRLEAAHVVPSIAARKALMLERIAEAAAAAGARLLEDDALADQVANLVELPNPVVGRFDERHLDLPPEVLIQEMKSHQRYFSLVDAQGRLLPRFVAVSNTRVRDERRSLAGYERVLRSRLADARFFFDEDRKTPLEERLPTLDRVVFQAKLGSYGDKVARVRELAAWLAGELELGTHAAVIDRAALLAKADLVTGMVGEFPELQGIMGREYARASGEPEAVAIAIAEHYLPRGAGDVLPATDAGAVVGLADRLDTLAGMFAIGKSPSGAADPFGLRRACLTLIAIVLARGYRFSMRSAFERALALHAAQSAARDVATTLTQLLEFLDGRLRNLWRAEHRADVVDAVLAAGFEDVVAAEKRLQALSAIVGRADFEPLAVAFKRVVNIVTKQGADVSSGAVSAGGFLEPAEKELHARASTAEARVATLLAKDDYAGALREITALKPAVDLFFDEVLVMAEDLAVRRNRLRLLAKISALFAGVADFTRIHGTEGEAA